MFPLHAQKCQKKVFLWHPHMRGICNQLRTHGWAEPRGAAAPLQVVRTLLGRDVCDFPPLFSENCHAVWCFVGFHWLLGLLLHDGWGFRSCSFANYWVVISRQDKGRWKDPLNFPRRALSAHPQRSVTPVWLVISSQLSTSALECKFCE